MLNSARSKILLVAFVALEISIAIFYHIGVIQTFWPFAIGVSVIAVLLHLMLNVSESISLTITNCLCLLIVLNSVASFSLSCGIVAQYVYTGVQNKIAVEKMENSREMEHPMYIHLFNYNDHQYYVDSDYTYVYEISANGFFPEINVNTIMIEEEFPIIKDISTDFFLIDENLLFDDKSKDSLSVSFYTGGKDQRCFIKILSQKNQVFYSYINLDNPIALIEDLGLKADTIKIGGTQIVLTNRTIITDGTGTSSGTKDGTSYLLTVNETLFASEIVTAKFEEGIRYQDRVNWFIYKDVIEVIEDCQEKIQDMDPESTEYQTVQNQIAALQTSMTPCQIELMYENVVENGEIRLYRVNDYSSEERAIPPISIIEIKVEGIYFYGFTELEIEDLF